MPLMSEPGSNHASMHWTADTGVDAAAATGLYWRAVPVTLRLQDREEHVADLTVRIMSGAARSGHATRVRRRSTTMQPSQKTLPHAEMQFSNLMGA